MNVLQICRFDGCRRAATYPGQARCEQHRLRWLPGKPVEPEPWKPAWLRRLSPKDFTGSAA